jgi:hypothetical protein
MEFADRVQAERARRTRSAGVQAKKIQAVFTAATGCGDTVS